jgi:hypothetical protein
LAFTVVVNASFIAAYLLKYFARIAVVLIRIVQIATNSIIQKIKRKIKWKIKITPSNRKTKNQMIS